MQIEKPIIVEDVSPQHLPVQAPEIEGNNNPDGAKGDVDIKKNDEPLSVKFAALTRRERMLLEKEKELKSREEKLKPTELTREAVKKNPKTALESVGMTFEEFTEAYLNQLEGKEHTPSTDDRINALYEKIEAKERADIEERAKKEKEIEEKAIYDFKEKIRASIESESEKYELINRSGVVDEVYNLIEEYFNDTGKVMDIFEAADHVEKHLEEEAEKIFASKKISSRFSPIKKLDTQGLPPSAVTLTNKQTASPAAPIAPKTLLPKEDSLARAAALLRWT